MALITMLFSVALSHQYCENPSTLDDLRTRCDAYSDTIGKVASFVRHPFSSSRSRTPSPTLEPPPRQPPGIIVKLRRKGELYAAYILIGNRQQPVEVIVDTGRTDTAIVKGQTGTSIVLPLPNFSRKPSNYHGVILEDNVRLGGLLVKHHFWNKSKLSIELGDKYESNVEGVLAMSPTENSASLQGHSFPRNVPLNVFALWLSYSIQPELHLGWIDEAVYTGDIEYHQIVDPGDLWMIEGGQIQVNGRIVLSGFTSIIDSGTPFIYGPLEDVAKIYRLLGGEVIGNRYYFPCDRVRSVSFTWGTNRQPWYIPDDIFKYSRFTRTKAGSHRPVTMCAGAIQYHSGLDKGKWRIGTLFLRSLYTVFDVQHKKVGFGKLRIGH
ncbi:aspartic peptidase domain-containing protein [Amanita rubescens]|nr:aspartic peptidase domain-containing protein [Amanita rubescens]